MLASDATQDETLCRTDGENDKLDGNSRTLPLGRRLVVGHNVLGFNSGSGGQNGYPHFFISTNSNLGHGKGWATLIQLAEAEALHLRMDFVRETLGPIRSYLNRLSGEFGGPLSPQSLFVSTIVTWLIWLMIFCATLCFLCSLISSGLEYCGFPEGLL